MNEFIKLDKTNYKEDRKRVVTFIIRTCNMFCVESSRELNQDFIICQISFNKELKQ